MFIMMLFILVPMVAPAIGQGILLLFIWRAIFAFILIIGLATTLWFFFRQPETLCVEKRSPFRI